MAKRPLIINILFVLLGGIIAVFWINLSGGRDLLFRMTLSNPYYLFLLLFITLFFIFFRFVRWQYLLRRIEVRTPTRSSLSIYLASLIGTATPAYIGEVLIRGALMRQKFFVPIKITTWIWIVERLFDALILGVISIGTSTTWWNRGLMSSIVVLSVLLFLIIGKLAPRVGIDEKSIAQLQNWKSIVLTIILSFIIWLPAAVLIYVAAVSNDIRINPIQGMNIFSTATILGGLTLSPAGFGATGSIAIIQLQSLSQSFQESVLIISLVRLTSTGLYLIIGTIFLGRELFALARSKSIKDSIHFDEIAPEYRSQFTDHVWDHLVNRKSSLMSTVIDASTNGGKGLDLGCGLGYQCLEMVKRGHNVFGTDISYQLISHARKAGANVANSDALALPFDSESLEYVYTIGVLHHLPNFGIQKNVCREVARILKPGGIFIIHETNPRNPLFRFYMGYIFPILKKIDEGNERWLDPALFESLTEMDLVNIEYFTFIPDFIPKNLLRYFKSIENWIENSRLRTYSVHYMAVVQKSGRQKALTS